MLQLSDIQYHLLIIGIVVLMGVFLVYAIIAYRRVKAVKDRQQKLTTIGESVLKLGSYYVNRVDLTTNYSMPIHGDLLPKEGMPVEEFVQHISPDQLEAFQQLAERVLSGKSRVEEISMRWNRGTAEQPDWRDYEGKAIAEYEKDKPCAILYAYREVTQEKKQEAELEKTMRRFKEIFDSNVVAMSLYDKEGVMLASNTAMMNLSSSSREQKDFFKNANMFDIPLFQDDLDLEHRDVVYVCHHVKMGRIDYETYVECRIKVVRNEQGEIAYYIVAIIDMTDVRQTGLELRRRAKELQQAHDDIVKSDEQMRNILQNSQIYTWYLDLKTHQIHVTGAKEGKTESVNSMEYMTNAIISDNRQEVLDYTQQCVKEQKPLSYICQFGYTPLDDKPVWYSVTATPHFDKQGMLLGYYGVNRNIDPYMQAQQQLKDETRRVNNLGELKSSFLANMTHEIRTPLNAVVGFSELLQMEESETERQEYIRIIHDNCDMLLRLLNDFVEASSIHDGMDFEEERQDFAQAFSDICQVLKPRVDEAGLEFIIDNPYTSLTLNFDKSRVQQLFTNFVTNAIKYTERGYIKVGYRVEENYLYGYCEDTGIGVPLDKQEMIFDRFVKLDEFVQGSGLGLNICKTMVEERGGEIGVISEGEGHGSTFWAKIPRKFPNKNNQ